MRGYLQLSGDSFFTSYFSWVVSLMRDIRNPLKGYAKAGRSKGWGLGLTFYIFGTCVNCKT